MQKLKTRATTFICNILISVLSLISIGSYFMMPLWRIEAKYHIEEQALEQMLKEMLEENASENEEMQNLDITELIDEEGLTIPLSICLETKDVLSALGNNGAEIAKKIIGDNVERVLDSFSEPLNKIAKGLTKTVTKQALHTAMNEQIVGALTEEKSEEEFNTLLTDAGITDDYISEKTDALVETIFSENATISSISSEVTNIVSEVFDKLSASDNEELKDLQLTDENKAEIEATVSEVLSKIANEDGTINVNDLIAKGLLALLNGETPPTEDATPSANANNGVKPLSTSNQDGDSTSDAAGDSTQSDSLQSDSSQSGSADGDMDSDTEETNPQEELKIMLREKVLEKLPENAAQQIANVLKYVSYILIFTFLTWLYLIVKFLIKLAALNNSIKLSVPLAWGWLPFLVLYILPTALFTLIKNPPTFMQKLLGADAIASITEKMSGLQITFSTGAWVSFAVAVFLFLFNAFFYKNLRKRLKAVTNGEIARVEENNMATIATPASEEISENANIAKEESTVSEDKKEASPEENAEETKANEEKNEEENQAQPTKKAEETTDKKEE